MNKAITNYFDCAIRFCYRVDLVNDCSRILREFCFKTLCDFNDGAQGFELRFPKRPPKSKTGRFSVLFVVCSGARQMKSVGPESPIKFRQIWVSWKQSRICDGQILRFSTWAVPFPEIVIFALRAGFVFVFPFVIC